MLSSIGNIMYGNLKGKISLVRENPEVVFIGKGTSGLASLRDYSKLSPRKKWRFAMTSEF